MSFGQQQQQQLQVPHQQSSSNSSSTVAGSSKKQPTFTMKQVVLLCERLWKEREEKLREEYNQVLNARLSGKVKPFLLFGIIMCWSKDSGSRTLVFKTTNPFSLLAFKNFQVSFLTLSRSWSKCFPNAFKVSMTKIFIVLSENPLKIREIAVYCFFKSLLVPDTM